MKRRLFGVYPHRKHEWCAKSARLQPRRIEEDQTMKEIRIPLEQFDLDAFLARSVEFLGGQASTEVDPTYLMVRVESPGDVPVFGPEDGWDVLSALKLESKMVFFPFAFADADGTLTCADGNTYGPVSDDKDPEDELFIGIEDSVGFLVQAEDNEVIINSAIHAGGACPGPLPSVDLCGDCQVLEGPMMRFIEGFVQSERQDDPLIDEYRDPQSWQLASEETTREVCEGDLNGLNVERIFLMDDRVVAMLDTRTPGSDLSDALERAGYCSLTYQERTQNTAPLTFMRDGGEYACHNLRANAAPLKLSRFPTPGLLYEFLRPQAEEFQGTLRSYQQDAVSQVLLSILSGRRRMYLQMAGGTGKTITAAAVIAKLASGGLIGRALFLVDRDALAGQAVRRLTGLLGGHFSIGRAQGVEEDKNKEILVSTVQHLATGCRYAGYDQSHFDLVILDECHRSYFGAWLPVVDHFSKGGAILLGLTATPSDRETVGTDQFFTDEGQYPGPIFRYTEHQGESDPHVPEWERLASCEHCVIQTDVDLEKVEEIGFDFEPEQLGRAVDVPQRNQLIAQTYFEDILENGQLVKTIAFATSVAHANDLARALIEEYNRRNNLPPDHPAAEKFIMPVHHEMANALTIIEQFQVIMEPSDRKAIIDQAMMNPDMEPIPIVLVGVGMLDTGIDVPDLEVLLMARPTMSKILYAQMKGRGTRKCRETEKASYKLVDFIDLCRKRPAVTNDTLRADHEDIFFEMGVADDGKGPSSDPEERPAELAHHLAGKRPAPVVYVPASASLMESISPEFFEALHRRLEAQLQRRLANELLRFRFAHALLTWRYLRGKSSVDGVFLTATGFDLPSLQALYGLPGGALEDIVSVAILELGLPSLGTNTKAGSLGASCDALL